jgi:hypothetical protein
VLVALLVARGRPACLALLLVATALPLVEAFTRFR